MEVWGMYVYERWQLWFWLGVAKKGENYEYSITNEYLRIKVYKARKSSITIEASVQLSDV